MEIKRTKTSSKLRENILQIMNDGNKRDIEQIKQALTEHGMLFNQDYNNNHLSGALNRLKSQEKLLCLERGVYQIPVSAENNSSVFNELYENINEYFKKGIQMITDGANSVDVSNLEPEDLTVLNRIIKMKKALEKELGE